MLVLSRKAGQRIHIGDDIVVEVRRVAGNRVTIALDAPRNVRILRGELERAAREFEIDAEDEAVRDQPESIRVARTSTPQFAKVMGHITANEMVG